MQSLPQVSGASAGSLLRPGQAACPIFRLPSNTAGSGSCSRSQPQLPGVLPEVAVAKHRRPGQSMKALSLSRKAEDVNGVVTSEAPKPKSLQPRTTLRLGLPSKGRMAEDTLKLFNDSALSVKKPNPRQYVAQIPQIPALEVWFQRASDVVRKLRYGDIDLGIVGYDMFAELADGDEDLIVVHDALDFGQCKLALGVPMTGKFAGVDSLEALCSMPQWTPETPLRVVTGYHNIAKRFFENAGLKNVVLMSADGALEAAPAMGSADIILDLVSTGVTLRENNLKEIEGGTIMQSQGILVASKKALMDRPGLLQVVHELIERFDAHLTAEQYFSVIANMKGTSPEDVANRLLRVPGLEGLQGPTIANVYNKNESGEAVHHVFAATICVTKKRIYSAVKALQKIGGSDVLVLPMTYIFNEEPVRWKNLLNALGLEAKDVY
mmetsp:Transcript_6000/g.15978  ORF Transcript_6000/g.15978 Transcript_6000/m.15978 type:complete len:437 (+) Transcript_6000:31-1341(+)